MYDFRGPSAAFGMNEVLGTRIVYRDSFLSKWRCSGGYAGRRRASLIKATGLAWEKSECASRNGAFSIKKRRASSRTRCRGGMRIYARGPGRRMAGVMASAGTTASFFSMEQLGFLQISHTAGGSLELERFRHERKPCGRRVGSVLPHTAEFDIHELRTPPPDKGLVSTLMDRRGERCSQTVC